MQSSPEIPGFALPTVVNPTDTVCFQINVPNDPGHLKAFYGVLYDLTIWKSWQRDAAHTGILAAQVWKQIWYNLRPSDDNCECAIPIAEMDVDMSVCEQIRFNPATGLFEGLCCGSWSPISGQPSQGLLGGQPGGGAPVPAGGQCQSYQFSLQANQQALCPAAVNTGDTIIITAQRGGWSDGTTWYCTQGGLYFAGLCGATSVNGADPLPTQPHMALLTKINGVYHNISDAVLFTVPAGVANKLLIFQANDSNLADNSGQIDFTVTVCNNQAAAWSSFVDFRNSTYGSFKSGVGGTLTYTPGVGWVFSLPVTSSGYAVELDFPAGTIVGVQTTIVATTVVLPSGSNKLRKLTPTVDIVSPLVAAGSGTQVTTYNNPAGLSATGLNWTMSGSVPGDGSGSWVLQSVLITGTGTKPAGLP